jgi:DNA polymerase III alpha subunit
MEVTSVESAELNHFIASFSRFKAVRRPSDIFVISANTTENCGEFATMKMRYRANASAMVMSIVSEERQRRPFDSLTDFYNRVVPTKAEAQNLIRAGAFDGFGQPRTTQFWHFHQLADWPHEGAQKMLFASADRELRVPATVLIEPSQLDRLKDEQELVGFTVGGHPLDLFPAIVWEKYCPSQTISPSA